MLALKLQARRSKVQEQSYIVVRGREIVDKLHFVGLAQRGDGFQFAEQIFVHYQVGNKVANNDILIANGDMPVDLDPEAGSA
jgi:hypothetical protein